MRQNERRPVAGARRRPSLQQLTVQHLRITFSPFTRACRVGPSLAAAFPNFSLHSLVCAFPFASTIFLFWVI
ncbi:hypothetical protein EXIGLDRAFT_261806 [Exidia glandulosa HHB12029]|uniref:Uncharacterized protein n=1 Tax=Exidia glandulosa HHB12029 TaxID=1314781 RepID=A0A165DTR0_EXIGL|nr:hypothetical protein EXIGLDRAFT_261806 [Exidia glandulosa HHB12029]